MLIITTINNAPMAIGIDKEVIKTIATVLDKRTNHGILSVLRVNPAASVLHRLCVKNLYPAVLKPIFIKEKTAKGTALSPFIVFDKDHVKSLNQHYPDINFAPVNLSYPLVHLRKLIQLGYVTIKKFNHGIFTLQSKGGQLFWAEMDLAREGKIDLTEVTAEQLIYSAAYQKIKLSSLKIFNNENKPVQVLGIILPEFHNMPLPIIADIDAHSFSQQNTRRSVIYNTHDDFQRHLLQLQVNQLLEKRIKQQPFKYLFHKSAKYVAHKHMGHITAEEVIFYYDISHDCKREENLLGIIQHGATCHMTSKDIKEVHTVFPQVHFPEIETDTAVGIIFPAALNRVAYITGKYILAFYIVMNHLAHYHFKIDPIWHHEAHALTQADMTLMKNELRYFGVLNANLDLSRPLPTHEMGKHYHEACEKLGEMLQAHSLFNRPKKIAHKKYCPSDEPTHFTFFKSRHDRLISTENTSWSLSNKLPICNL